MITSVSSPSTTNQGPSPTCTTLVKVVAQLAVRIISIVGSIVLAAAHLPLHMHSYALPLVGIFSALLSSFFFPEKKAPISNCVSSLIEPCIEGKMPRTMPVNAPRGLVNDGNNCALNSLVHLITSHEHLLEKMQALPKDDMSLEEFLTFIEDYEFEPELIEAFQEHVKEGPLPQLPISLQFQQFLKEWDDRRYTAVETLRKPLNEFFSQYRSSVEENLSIATCNTQTIREVLYKINNKISPSAASKQPDAEEVLNALFSCLPEKCHLKTETTYTLSDENMAAPAENPQRKQPGKILPIWTLSLATDEEEPSLKSLIEHYLKNSNASPLRAVGTDGVERIYPIKEVTTECLNSPESLCFRINRSVHEEPKSSWWGYLFPWIFPDTGGMKKLETPLLIPDELTIPIQKEQEATYRIKSFVLHIGTPDSGHYIAGKIVNGSYYIIDDKEVKVVSKEEWNLRAKQAYLLSYQLQDPPHPVGQ